MFGLILAIVMSKIGLALYKIWLWAKACGACKNIKLYSKKPMSAHLRKDEEQCGCFCQSRPF